MQNEKYLYYIIKVNTSKLFEKTNKLVLKYKIYEIILIIITINQSD